MADLEYGDRFAVYLTPDRGVRYLTNDFGIRTMELLSKEVMTIAELSEALGVSRSTAQSGLARMVRTGLLRTSHDPPQSKNGRTVYWSCSVCIFRRFNYGDSEHIRDSALGSILRGNDQWFDLSMLVALALGRRGIDFSPILFLLGIHVGKLMAPVAPEGDAAKLIRDFTALLGFDHEVDVDPDLSKHLRITFAAQERFSETLFISPVVTGYLMAMLESRTGAVFSTDLSLEWDVASGTITTETSRFFGRPPFVRSDSDNGPNPMNLVPERPFAIYLVDGTPLLVGSQCMMDVLDALVEPMTVGAVHRETGILTVTIHSVLAKLESIGAVTRDETGGVKNLLFRSEAAPLFRVRPCILPLVDESKFVMAWDKGMVYRLCHEYIVRIMACVGLELDDTILNIGRTVAWELLRRNPGMGAQDFIDNVCRLPFSDNIQVRCVTYIPVRMEVIRHDGLEPMMRKTLLYIEGMVSEGLRITTGDDYKVVVEGRFVPKEGDAAEGRGQFL